MIGQIREMYGICLPSIQKKTHSTLFISLKAWSVNYITDQHSKKMSSDRKSDNGTSVPGRDLAMDSGRGASPSTSPTRSRTMQRQSTETDHEKIPTDVEMIDGHPKDEFDRFTQSQKRRMTAIVSFSALLSRQLPLYFCRHDRKLTE